jgi:acyl-CoA reductase-like NAD-dependent aldehyde dehydrogenase
MITRLLLTLVISLLLANTAFAQRDYLTPQEVDLVKEAQILDKRIDVFIRAAERRLITINGSAAANAKQLKKESERWGDLPAGSRAELVSDIARIVDAAIDNIDNVSMHDERSPLISKSLRKLAASMNAIMAQLKPFGEQAKSDAEVASFEQLNEGVKSIMEAATKLPPEVEKKAKKDKN